MQPNPETIKAVGDYGMLVVTGALYLCLSGGLMWFCVKWFKTLISDIITSQQENSKLLIHELKEQGSLISSIAERLQSETLLRLNVVFDFAFGYLTEQVCCIVEQVASEQTNSKEKNEQKVKLLVDNAFYQVKSGLSYFSWRGARVDKFFQREWQTLITAAVLSEIEVDSINKERYHSLFENYIKNIKNELLKALTEGYDKGI